MQVHQWRRALLTLCLPVTRRLLLCATRSGGSSVHVCPRQVDWRRMSTGIWSNGEALPPVGAGQGTGCPEQGENLLDCSHGSLAQSQQQSGGAQIARLDGAVASLRDMGLSDAQISQLFALQPAGSADVQQRLTVVSELLLLGLNPGTVLKVLEKCPDVLRVTAWQLKDRIEHLRRLGLGEGSLQRVVSYYPGLLTISRKRAGIVVRCLKERCHFSTQQVTEILRTCPGILQEQPDDLEYKFQYAYFCLGIQQQEMVQTRLFQASLLEMKYRHSFLERLGRYQSPDKKGQTQICNPKLKEILGLSENAFLAKIACSSSEEFQVFKRLLDREEEEQIEEEEGSSDSTSDGEETDSDEEVHK